MFSDVPNDCANAALQRFGHLTAVVCSASFRYKAKIGEGAAGVFKPSCTTKCAECGLNFLLGSDPTILRLVDRGELRWRRVIDATAPGLDVANNFSQLLLILLGPSFHSAQYFFDVRAHTFNISY
jgi:hypothetical protein